MQLWETAASLHVPVFPCRADKRPSCPHGFKDAEWEPDKIAALFQANPGELIGVPTGAVSGIDALDIDAPRHAEAKDWLAKAYLPATRIHQTRSGGWHYIFRHHPGLNGWSGRPVVGIDGRADGGYIVWWPAAGYAVNSVDPIEWPARILKTVAATRKPAPTIEPYGPVNDQKLAGIVRSVAGAVNGTRNDLLYWGACRVSEWIEAGEIARSAGEAVLTSAAKRSGLDDIETAKTIASAFNRGARSGDTA